VNNNDTKRISRLTAIITQLQTKRLVTAPELASKFSVSVRTIYRDIRALEQAGIPIYVEEGKGYRIMEHYRLPPVMFTESEANALITMVLKPRCVDSKQRASFRCLPYSSRNLAFAAKFQSSSDKTEATYPEPNRH
jgi:predicted DNA-binding transcriptional regulator YafY